MTTMVGEFLTPPALRFDYSSSSVCAPDARRGLKEHGPYDKNILGKENIRAAVVFPSNHTAGKATVLDAMANGHGQFFSGFQNLFRIPFVIDSE